nr:hypothetical protein [uncultured Rhodococcus sp.]
MSRLTYDDDLFLRMECVLNVPVVNQIVWRFDDAVPREAANAMWRNLSEGTLGRTVERVRVPGARDRWTRASHTLPLDVTDAGIPASQLGQWMRERAATALNPIDGPVWQLAYTTIEEGGSAMSLVASHVVGDGGALTSAAIAAIEGPGDPEDFCSAWDRPIEADVRDAAGQFGAAARGAARVLARSVRGALSGSPGSAPVSAEPSASGAVVGPLAVGDFTPSTVVVDCPTEEWTAAAAAAGGSANSLLVAVALGILAGSGRVEGAAPIKVSLPVSTRVPGDIRANATSGVSIQVEGHQGYRADLSQIRSKSKAAFTALADVSEPTSFELAKPLMQMLPDVIVAQASRSATAPLCLCSNLGDRGARARSIGGVPARSVAMRSITQNTTAELLRRTKGGVSVWWNISGETATLCVTGLDPDHFPTVEHLRALISDEYDKWELTPTYW